VRRSGRNIPDIPEKLVKNRGARIEIVAGVGHCIAVGLLSKRRFSKSE